MNILLTGSRGGIGSATLELLESGGHRVIGIDREDYDITNYAELETLEANIAAEGVELDWIVFAHGFIDAEGNVEKERASDIAEAFAVNITSIVYFAKLFLKHLAPGGGMVALASTAALSASGHRATYSASKAAVITFMQALARNRPGQSFFSICPGPTNTKMRTKIADDAANTQPPSAVAEAIVKVITTKDYKTGDVLVVKDGKTSTALHLAK